MGSLAAIFLSHDLADTAKRAVGFLEETTNEPGHARTGADDFASADLIAAAFLFSRIESEVQHPPDGGLAPYLNQVRQHLERSLAWGSAARLSNHAGDAAPALPERVASTLALPTIRAEVGLAIVAWLSNEREQSIALLESALAKARAVAAVRPAQLESVDEYESVTVASGLVSRQRSWRYKGLRPAAGSAGRLAQDIEFALLTAQGQNPSPDQVYKPWIRVVNSQPK